MSGERLPKSVASLKKLDEEHIRKVVADNPDLLHARFAVRFGISIARLRKIIGWKKKGGELLTKKDKPAIRGTSYAERDTGFRERQDAYRKAIWRRSPLPMNPYPDQSGAITNHKARR